VVGVNLAGFAALFLVLGLAVHIVWTDGNPWLERPFAKSKFRIANPRHTLAPNYAGQDEWAPLNNRICRAI
jgi:hypothetical protein